MPTDLKARLKVGSLREKCSLYKPVEVRQQTGTVKQTYSLVDDEVWAEIIHLFGAALYFAAQMQPLQNSTVTIRYRGDIRSGWLLIDEMGVYSFTVQGIPTDLNNRHTLLKLACQAQQVGALGEANPYHGEIA
jgi:SPP1 family predicted phage head-tail adaptor